MRQAGKAAFNVLSILLIAPACLAYVVAASALGTARIFPGFSQLFSLLPGVTGQFLRRAFYRLVLPQCGRDACVCFSTVFSHPSAELGNHVYVGVGCMVGDATLGDDVLVGSHVSIINGGQQHGVSRLDMPVRLQPGVYPRITIGRDSWVGDRAVVMADIGRHCVVAAGAIVTKPVPDFAIVAGNPARIIGWRRAPDAEEEGPASDRFLQEVQAAPPRHASADESTTI